MREIQESDLKKTRENDTLVMDVSSRKDAEQIIFVDNKNNIVGDAYVIKDYVFTPTLVKDTWKNVGRIRKGFFGMGASRSVHVEEKPHVLVRPKEEPLPTLPPAPPQNNSVLKDFFPEREEINRMHEETNRIREAEQQKEIKTLRTMLVKSITSKDYRDGFIEGMRYYDENKNDPAT